MKKIIYVCTFFLLTLAIYSENRIVSIDIQGLKRTKDETVLRIMKIQLGDIWQEGSEEMIEQRLLHSGIFQNEIDFQVKEVSEGVELVIQLQDKWTLLAIPFYGVSEGESRGGLFAFDSNFLGRQQMLALAGLYSESEQMLFMLYEIPRINGSPFLYHQSLSWRYKVISLLDTNGKDEIGNYSMSLLGSTLRVGYEFSDEFMLYLQGRFYYRELDDISYELNIDEGNSVSFEPVLRLEYTDMYVYSVFSKGIECDWESSLHFEGGDIFHSHRGSALYSHVPIEWLQVQLYGEGFYTQGDLPSFILIGKQRASNTLPDQRIAADSYFSTEASIEFRIIPLSFGCITMPVFFEAGIFTGIEEDQIPYYGLGGGIRLYVDKVAIPAIGLEYHYNLSGAGGNIAFSIGMAF